MPELALDDVHRDALPGELNGMSVAELMRREATSDPSCGRESSQLTTGSGCRPPPPAGLAINDAEQRPSRQQHPVGLPRGELREPKWVHARLSPLIPLTVADQHRTPGAINVSLAEGKASEMRSPPRQSTAISARMRSPWRSWPAWRITRTISSGRGGSGGYSIPLLRGARPAKKPGRVAGERRRPAASINIVASDIKSLQRGGASQPIQDAVPAILPSPLLRLEATGKQQPGDTLTCS